MAASGDHKSVPLSHVPFIGNTALFVFDFDNTISSQHLHNKIVQNLHLVGKDPEKQWQLVKDIPVLGDPARWKKIIEEILKRNHLVSIASFNDFEHIIKRYLIEKVGLNANTVNEFIFIRSGLPKDPQTNKSLNPNTTDKNLYIESIRGYYMFSGYMFDNENIILTDDSPFNLSQAEKAGYTVIPADKQARHLDILERAIGLTKANDPTLFGKASGATAASPPPAAAASTQAPPKPGPASKSST